MQRPRRNARNFSNNRMMYRNAMRPFVVCVVMGGRRREKNLAVRRVPPRVVSLPIKRRKGL